MSRLRFGISISLDGFIAGPDQSIENPLGIGGEGLHDWVVCLRVWREMHGMEGGEVTESSQVVEESIANIGATIMGRNMFGGHPGPWDRTKPWEGWWGADPPFHHPVFVVTNHARPSLPREAGTTFHFVTEGPGAALEQARRAAGEKDIALAGGANVARQYLSAGLVDEMELHLVPILLGSGERLFEGLSDLRGLKLVRTVAAADVTHLKFRKE